MHSEQTSSFLPRVSIQSMFLDKYVILFSVAIEAQIKSRTTVVLCDVEIKTDCKCEELRPQDIDIAPQYVKKSY